MSGRVVTLIYHDVVTPSERDAVGFPGPAAGLYKLTPDRFEAHLGAIAEVAGRSGSEGRARVKLTFDDGGASATWIASALERHGLRGTFFVVTSRIGTAGFVDPDGVRELAARGHEVGSHTDSHPAYMRRLERSAVAEEWSRSRAALERILGSPPSCAAVPGGSVSGVVVEEAARAGYERLYTSTPRLVSRRAHGMTVIGRFSIWANDPPALAAAIAGRRREVLARRWLGWQVKSAAKRVSPARYEAARRVIAARRSAAVKNDNNRAV